MSLLKWFKPVANDSKKDKMSETNTPSGADAATNPVPLSKRTSSSTERAKRALLLPQPAPDVPQPVQKRHATAPVDQLRQEQTQADSEESKDVHKSTLTEEQLAKIEENKRRAQELLEHKRRKLMPGKSMVQSSTALVPSSGLLRRTVSAPADAAPVGDSPFVHIEDTIERSWYEVMSNEFQKTYFMALKRFLDQQWHRGVKMFPSPQHVFRAFDLCPFDKVRVVILGQDPYHNDGQAEGLCFSVPPGVAVPSSLRNIYKELADDIPDFKRPSHGHLGKWAAQGILMLNTGLTVKAHEANSHKGKGWQTFTDAAISQLSKKKKGLVFLLWGKHAQDRAVHIQAKKHHLLMCPHPSGLSAHRGFFGCKHFSKTNELLEQEGQAPIDWQV